MALCDNSRQPIGTHMNMDLLLELIYAEISSISENISYLKGRCDSIIEICAVCRMTNPNKKYKTKKEKELYKIEKILLDVKGELGNFSDKITERLNSCIKIYEQDILKRKSKYINTMQGND